MELGQKLKQARLEAGLSQRQLCGDEITRNMLSQIENGSARPSMDTLRFLAGRLGKTVSYFLEEDAVTSPNQALMTQARSAFAAAQFDQVLELLEGYRQPDGVFDWEMKLLAALCGMELAQQAIARKQLPYARQLLERSAEAGRSTPYFDTATERRRLLLLAQTCSGPAIRLPADDGELLVRAQAALEEKRFLRAGQYLDAAEDHSAPAWNFLRGRAFVGQEQFPDAVGCLRAAEGTYPLECAALLEQCCLAQEDYKGAYEYARKLRASEIKTTLSN